MLAAIRARAGRGGAGGGGAERQLLLHIELPLRGRARAPAPPPEPRVGRGALGVDFAIVKTGDQGPDAASAQARPDHGRARGRRSVARRRVPGDRRVPLPDGSGHGADAARPVTDPGTAAPPRRLTGAAWPGTWPTGPRAARASACARVPDDALRARRGGRVTVEAESALVGERARRPPLRIARCGCVARGLLLNPVGSRPPARSSSSTSGSSTWSGSGSPSGIWASSCARSAAWRAARSTWTKARRAGARRWPGPAVLRARLAWRPDAPRSVHAPRRRRPLRRGAAAEAPGGLDREKLRPDPTPAPPLPVAWRRFGPAGAARCRARLEMPPSDGRRRPPRRKGVTLMAESLAATRRRGRPRS